MNNYSFFKLLLIILTVSLTSCIISNYDQPCRISGKVTDTSGKGIGDVIIAPNEAPSKETTKTASDGSYKIDFLTGGTVNLAFSKVGYTGKTSDFVLLGGEKKVLDVKLNTLSEDAYFKVATKEKTILNTGESFSTGINTNVSYEYESMSPWITCVKYGSDLSIKCDSNETLVERNAIIILRAEYNHNDTIKIKQLAGPILRVLDYIGKNNTYFPQTMPFVTFSREVSVLSATGSNVSLAFELSTDKKTVSFSNIKLNAFSTMPIQLAVIASDGIQLNFNFNLKLFVNSQSILQRSNESSVFTADNKSVWIFTSDYRFENIVLKQYSTNDFSVTKQILNESFYIMRYNPFNNCLYLIKSVYFEDHYVSEISLYDASSGIFKNKFRIDYNGNQVEDIEFSNSGYGLMILGYELFYIDSSNNHKWGPFTTSSNLYDPHQINWLLTRYIELCNNNKTFVLYGEDTGGTISVYTVSADTKDLARIFNTVGYHNVITSNSGSRALYFYENANNIICQNVLDKTTKTLTLPSSGIRNTALLLADDSSPNILTSDFSVISVNDNSIHNFAHQGECYYLESSNDGKLVLVNNNGTVYLFKSEVFTNYSNFIK